jgi:hypothetical protein
MRQIRSIGTGLAVLLGLVGWTGLAGAQLPVTGPYVPTPVPQGAPTPASPAPAQTQASKPPSAAGGGVPRSTKSLAQGAGEGSCLLRSGESAGYPGSAGQTNVSGRQWCHGAAPRRGDGGSGR